MSQSINTCNKCKSQKLVTVKVINPNTQKINMDVKMRCEDCGHEDTYQSTSNYYQQLSREGKVML